MAKILMIIAPDKYQDKEFEVPKKIIEEAGHQVEVASMYKGLAKGKLGGSYQVDLSIREVVVDNYAGILFVGGPGAVIYLENSDAHHIVRIAAETNKAIGAICMAPSILANAGVLSGYKVSAFPSEEQNLRNKGAEIMSSDVTLDRKIVTGSGPYAAREFGFRFVEAINK